MKARAYSFLSLLTVSLSIVSPSATLAVHDTDTFELEGDALDDGGLDGDDWDRVLLGDGGGAFAVTEDPEDGTGVVSDGLGATIFTGGGSKDPIDIPSWRHKDGSVPDKDDLRNAYAAAYLIEGDLVVHFGADRFANDGDAQMGFWFFRNGVVAQPDGTFSGSHRVGDLLIVANFTNGGSVGTIQVLEWVGSGGNQKGGTLDLLFEASDADCASANLSGGDLVCATLNRSPETAPWPYVPKSGTAGEFPFGSFFEGGINISQVLGQNTCFASFLAETRSSTSVTATLKDFVLGKFDVCGLEVTKECSLAVNSSGDGVDVTLTGTVANTGAVTLTDMAISDVPPADELGFVDCTTQDPLATPVSLPSGETICFLGTTTTANTTAVDTITVTGMAGDSVVESQANAVCSLDATPSLSVTKQCTDAIGEGGAITFSGELCNDGDMAIGSLTLTDDLAGSIPLSSTRLAPGECVAYSGSHVPASTPSTNTVTAQGVDLLGNLPVVARASSTCGVQTSPQLAVTKSCSDAVGEGGSITFSGQVCNSGNVTLISVQASDDLAGALSLSATTLVPGDCASYSGSHQPTSSPSTNTVTATATDRIDGGGVSDQASSTCSIQTSPQLTVTKSCQDAAFPPPGQDVSFSGEICNVGNVTLQGIVLVDDKAGPVGLPKTTLGLNECMSYSGIYTPTTSTSTNTVSVSATDAIHTGQTATGTASATCFACPVVP